MSVAVMVASPSATRASMVPKFAAPSRRVRR
jgi:hypothetical protein